MRNERWDECEWMTPSNIDISVLFLVITNWALWVRWNIDILSYHYAIISYITIYDWYIINGRYRYDDNDVVIINDISSW